MAKSPTAADAHVVPGSMACAEAEIRRARNWWAVNFWLQSADDMVKVINTFGSRENDWFRQVAGYWEMPSSLVLRALSTRVCFTTRAVKCGSCWARSIPL